MKSLRFEYIDTSKKNYLYLDKLDTIREVPCINSLNKIRVVLLAAAPA